MKENLHRILQTSNIQKTQKSHLSLLLYTYRYHNTLPLVYTQSLVNVLCYRLDKADPSSKDYAIFLQNLCVLSSMRKLPDLKLFKFKEYFMKYQGKFSWNQLKDISFFLNFFRLNDRDCLNRFNNEFSEYLLYTSKKNEQEMKSKYYLNFLRTCFSSEDLKIEKIMTILDRYPEFSQDMTVSQKISMINNLKTYGSQEISNYYKDFIEKHKIMEDIENSLKDLPLNNLIQFWNRIINLNLINQKLEKMLKIEVLERRNFLSEQNILNMTYILKNSKDEIENKKDLANVLKNTMMEKVKANIISLSMFTKITQFLLNLKEFELITSEEIEEFFFKNFFLKANPELFRLTLINMINLSKQNYGKINKFISWNISQIIAKLEEMPTNKLFEIFYCLKNLIKINQDILLSLDLYTTNRLSMQNDKNIKDLTKEEIIEKYSLRMLRIFLNKEIKNTDSPIEFNNAFRSLMKEIKINGLYEIFFDVPLKSEHIQLLDNKNKLILENIINQGFDLFYEKEKNDLIQLLYGFSTKIDKIFIEKLSS